MTRLLPPEKLKDDCILEAICEVRFDTSEQPEIVIGRLSDQDPWKDFSKGRLPTAEIPASLRAVNEQLRYQPVLQLRSADGASLLKVGSNVVSYHSVDKYCGWKQFQPALISVFEMLFACVKDAAINKIGFRYVNAITSNRHYIADVNSLDLNVEVNGEELGEPINLNYLVKNDDAHATMTRIASPYFVQGALPKDTTVVVDIDVSSPAHFQVKETSAAVAWVETAHKFEKEAFFKLIPSEILEKLVEK
ncbi:MAG: TIGR04255 family protein [Gammaproteobacteria bacterium]|nr:TIGR04255 family protein [Gammaproteobacteria bacterium]